MYCSKCGSENSDDARVCRSCGAVLVPPPIQTPGLGVKTSRMAIAALVLGILCIFTCGLTTIPAIILGIVSLVKIEKSGGRLTGRGFAIAGIVVPVVAIPIILILMGILIPAYAKTRQTAYRMACATNLSGIGKAMLIYSNDYNDELPRSGGKNTVWGSRIPDWKATNRYDAYGLAADGSGGTGSISSCFYLLVKYAEVTPKSFLCRGGFGAGFVPILEGVGDRDLIDFWDFGPEPQKHCSYSYHQPFSSYPLTASSEPGVAVAADRNPWLDAPSYYAKTYPGPFNPDGGTEAQKAGNAVQHQEDGQNVLFLDGHVGFERISFCAVDDDNIYTYWDGGDIRKGGAPIPGASEPKDKSDSFLVHDGRGAASEAPVIPVPER